MARRTDRTGRARTLSRRLATQALYQWQLTGQGAADLRNQYASAEGYGEADADHFAALVDGVTASSARLDEELSGLIDRPVTQLDPIEHAILLIGLFELGQCPEVPYRVVINEGVDLAKRFGATEGHKFVNAVLDRAARVLRATERAAASGTTRA